MSGRGVLRGFARDLTEGRHLVRAFRRAGACTGEFARGLDELGVRQSMVLRRLIRKGVIVHGGGQTYFLDERRLLDRRMAAFKWGMISLLLLLLILMQFIIRSR